MRRLCSVFQTFPPLPLEHRSVDGAQIPIFTAKPRLSLRGDIASRDRGESTRRKDQACDRRDRSGHERFYRTDRYQYAADRAAEHPIAATLGRLLVTIVFVQREIIAHRWLHSPETA